MSRRVGKGMRNQGQKEEKRPPSHVALDAIQSMTNVLMCRSCGMKMFCPHPMQCRMEALLEAKVTMLSEKMGKENIKKLLPPELAEKMRDIPDEDAIKFIQGVLSDVKPDKEPLQEDGEEEVKIEETDKGTGDVQDPERVDEGVQEAEDTESMEKDN